jgi:FdhE protein
MITDSASDNKKQTGNTSPVIIFPDPSDIFLQRSRRFTTLAAGHTLGDWLRFLARITEAQHKLLQTYSQFPQPDAATLSPARKHCLPPVPAQSWPRDPSWRQILTGLADLIAPDAPALVREILDRLLALDAVAVEALADQVLRGELRGNRADLLPFVAAAQQVYWTALVAGLDKTMITPPDSPGVCPCCGFLPVASIVRTDGEVAGLRYLHCALCNTEWNLVRVTCAACNDNNGIAYHHIEGSDQAVRAETCDACKSYLKIIYRKNSLSADPIADDLATLALDMLIDEAGYNRIGPNLLFVPGTASADKEAITA